MEIEANKSIIQETLNLSVCADSSTDTKTDGNRQIFFLFFINFNEMFEIHPFIDNLMCGTEKQVMIEKQLR